MALTVQCGSVPGNPAVIASAGCTISATGEVADTVFAGTAGSPVTASMIAVSLALNVRLSVSDALRFMFVLSNWHPVLPETDVSSLVFPPVPETMHIVSGLFPTVPETVVASTGDVAPGAP